MDVGIDLLAHIVVELARQPDFSSERAELEVFLVLAQYMQVTGKGVGGEGLLTSSRHPAGAAP